ncbi:GNAT family N-acetyltransferase ['Paenibacillus yunnanensis' Narsing Rao et al. 2020]|uniref:GNAT family N-acetyltransferase n=1 Tax=Paenibacillus tengchongensis TaxID=2608684 RepID=UPI00124EF9AA|nr:GNAT family N-acetyltransferase [Paenibacillus tengchongensis]
MSLLVSAGLPGLQEYYELYSSTGWDPDGQWDAERLHQALRNSWYVAVIYSNGKLAASGRIVSDGVIQCLICDVIVSPEYRSRGFGKAMMEHLLEHCKQSGIRWVQLSAAAGKAGFYEQFGFVRRPADAPGMSLHF